MYVLSCESTVDLTSRYLENRNIPVIAYSYIIDGKEYFDKMNDDFDEFYKNLEAGKIPTTSQICVDRYKEFFREQLNKGDLLHIAFDSGLSRSVENAFTAAKELKGEFTDKKILVVDSTCGSLGYGLLVDTLADMRDSKNSIEELYDFAANTRMNVHHQFFTTTMKYFRKSGRVSTPAALIGDLLHICPVMRVNKDGKIVVSGKTVNVRRAIDRTKQEIRQNIAGGECYGDRLWVAHSNCFETAEKLKNDLQNEYPKADVKLWNLGKIIASHCGPGTVAVFYYGKERN